MRSLWTSLNAIEAAHRTASGATAATTAILNAKMLPRELGKA